MEREAFLDRVRSAMATADLPTAPVQAPGRLVPDLGIANLLDRFIERLESVDGTAHRVSNDSEAIAAVGSVLEEYEADRYLSWDPEYLPVVGLLDSLAGIREPDTVATDGTARLDHQAGYMNLRAGITGTIGALADSGTIILDAGPGRARMASLIPLVHIALLRESDIAPGLSHWMAEHADRVAATSNLVFITGPSRTADIEQVLNLGVHGPKHLHVVIVAGS